MKISYVYLIVFLSFFLVLSSDCNATLIDRGNGLIYDTDLNITWLKDTNIAGTGMTWEAAMAWVEALVFAGYDDWRLPNSPATQQGFINEGEMGHLYYTTLKNPSGGPMTNVGPFINFPEPKVFWLSATPLHPGSAWNFEFIGGMQNASSSTNGWYAWPVRDGDSISGEPPVADAGQDVEAPANAKVVLDGSASYDPDGMITQYIWTRLPDNVAFSSTTVPTCNTKTSKCEIKTLGLAEEVIELTVVDNDGYFGKDTLSIYHRRRAVCGNGKIEEGEVCDGDPANCPNGDPGTAHCINQCTYIECQYCGDGFVTSNEACDSNSESCLTNNGYVGTKTCNEQCSGFGDCQGCGDGVVNGDEICDDMITYPCKTDWGYNGTKLCMQCSGFKPCEANEFCGDHVINGPEVCDGNTQSCTTTAGYAGTQKCRETGDVGGRCNGFIPCTSTLSCGDGICTAPPETIANCAQDCTPIEIIVDNTNTAYVQSVGPWAASSGITGYYGTNYLWLRPGTGINNFSWLPNIAKTGTYEVFARWAAYSNRATDAKYTITHSGGNTTVTVNQQINGGVWYSLGKFNFSAGTGAKITLTDNANNIVVADAIRLLGGS